MIIVTAFLAGRLITRRNLGIAAQSTRTAVAGEMPTQQEQEPAQTPTSSVKSATGNEKVTSWTGGNSIHTLLPLRDIIYTGGPGGITEWNAATGAATQWTMRDGLPASQVTVLFQEPSGGIWIGTTAGLVHLTSTARELYTSYDGLDSDYVTGLAWRGDQLLIGTQYCGGDGCGLLTKTGIKLEAFKGFPSKDEPDNTHVSHNIHFVYVDKLNQVWVGTDTGLALLDRRNRWRVFNNSNGLPGNLVYSILEDATGSIWIGTDEGGVSKFDSGNATFKQMLDLREQGIYDVYSMLQTNDAHIWLAGYSLVEYDPKTENLIRYSPYENNFPVYNPVTLAAGLNGVLYVGTIGEGLIRFENGTATQWLIPNVPGEAGYREIVPAGDGSLYFIEEYWNNVDQFYPATGEWKNGLVEDISIPRAIDPEGKIWGGSWDGLWIISPTQSRKNLTTQEGLPSDEINAIAFDQNGNAWVATQGGLVTIRDEVVVGVKPGSELSLENDAVRKVFIDSQGGVWAAGESGGNMGYMPPGGNWEIVSAYQLFGIRPEAITDFAELPNGDTLIATDGGGLFRRTLDGEWTRTRTGDSGVTQPIDYIQSLAVAPDGSLWLGLDDRVVRFDGTTWKGFTIKDGLSGLIIYEIYIDPDGSVWFATNGGVTRFEP